MSERIPKIAVGRVGYAGPLSIDVVPTPFLFRYDVKDGEDVLIVPIALVNSDTFVSEMQYLSEYFTSKKEGDER